MNFFKHTDNGLLQPLLKGIVDASMAVVDVGLLTSKIHKSATHTHTLIMTTASASEEMVSTVKGIAGHASEASNTANRVGQEVDDAINVMQTIHSKMANTTECMSMLKNASNQIQNVVKTINEISEQTNLLALNASIEAARAGDAGRGFAVVADEVRKLATQSQRATGEISNTIGEIEREVDKVFSAVEASQKSVDEGTEKVSKLRTSAKEIEGLMQSIANSTEEQSEASQQISESILSVSQEAEQNEKQTANIMELLDNLTNVIEAQRMLLAEQDIPGKVVVLAQADHALWKKKIVDFEMGRIELDGNAIGDHTTCRLGKWYYANGKKEFGENSNFTEMEGPHIHVHDAAKEAIERRKNDPGADVSDLVQKLESASVEVIASLQRIEN